jgi:predicted AlkP superfamily pyrophosphatase or phosphodiesterase
VRLGLAFGLALFFFLPHTAAQSAAPSLVVIIVVDQMRADYVDRFEKDWTGGLKRFVSHGAWYANAAYPYLTTVTCAGHATISTGTLPHTHGVFQNEWWDREAGAEVTCTEDPRASDVGYRVRATGGDSAWRLQRPTLTDRLRTERKARVVTLSLKERSAIMLAGHGGDAVTWLSSSLDAWTTSSVFSPQPVPAVKAFVDANPIAADFGKTWKRILPPSRFQGADDQAGETPPRGWTRSFPHVLTGTSHAPDATFFAQWERSPFADDYLGRFAIALSDAFSLGRRGGDLTDVLAISFSTPDLVGHEFGPASQEEQDLYAHLDRTIGALFDHLDATVGAGRWVAALSSDHGVSAIPEQLVAMGKDAGRLDSAAIADLIDARLRKALGGGRYVAGSSGNDIYFEPGVFDRLQRSPDLMNPVIGAITRLPGIARVFRSSELRDPAVAVDALQRAAALSYFPGRSGDLILASKPGWVFSSTGTTHGTASPDDQRVPLMFVGFGVKPGRYQDAATPADLAPTLAAIAGVNMSGVEGRVLQTARQTHH